ncbi:TyeA family type III secretion system gatekeeper subunit [Variovorax sp. KK3]|uniref:TyeA family type III secretion system gatekeeper subunit n=1 Tax=Variovorax sp. KK3 TaxID=1855728 RepID=UPI00097BB181|nr:TyeA family type III secretion system gatekeeper subunit [Variovorax sp. KK3]
MNDGPFDTTALLRLVLEMIASEYPSRMQVESLLKRLRATEGAAQIICLQGLLNLMRALPMHVYSSDDDRLALIAAAREVLDAAIDAEEAVNLKNGAEQDGAARLIPPETVHQ